MELADFEGKWRVMRRIDDRLAGRQGRFEGVVLFHPDGIGLTCRESGEMSFDGMKPMAATRTYLWRAFEQGIEVLFDDGRPFHRINAAREVSASHWCDPDTYDVTYDFGPWPDWRATWTVRGPRKDYSMVSEYLRITP